MVVPSVLPKMAPTTFGTPDLVDRARASGYQRARLIMPPVDIELNSPDPLSAHSFRCQYGIDEHDILLVTVSRLVDWMKAGSLRRTMEAVRTLGADRRLRFAIVGDGTARDNLERFAAQVNSELGRNAALLTGALLYPSPAYAAADVIVGMGGSALRGMAFSKPVIVVGERGFSELFTPQTENFFYYNGMFGKGDGSAGNDQLVNEIRRLLGSSQERISLGEFARGFVERRYSIEIIGRELNDLLVSATISPLRLPHLIRDASRTASLVAANELLPRKLHGILRGSW